jgi:hypothetical protein
MLMHCLNRKGSTVVLSETLDENAMQTLLALSIANRFSKQCDEWHAEKKGIFDFHAQERTKREQNISEELASKEHEMRQMFYEVVVEDVMALFPCVIYHFPGSWNAQATGLNF